MRSELGTQNALKSLGLFPCIPIDFRQGFKWEVWDLFSVHDTDEGTKERNGCNKEYCNWKQREDMITEKELHQAFCKSDSLSEKQFHNSVNMQWFCAFFFLISLSNCTRGSIAVMKSICHSLPADCNLHLHCSLSYRCMGNMEWRNLVCWISNFYRENRVQGVLGGLWPIVPSAQRLVYIRTVCDWTHDRASPPSTV